MRGFQPNTYTFTKALAERLMEDASEDLPVIITRPSIGERAGWALLRASLRLGACHPHSSCFRATLAVVGSIRDPMPGRMDNLNGLAGFWAGGFKGVIATLKGPNVTFDTAPVDFVTQFLLLASWAKGLGLSVR